MQRYPLPFTPHGEFQARRRFIASGVTYTAGQIIDKATMSVRHLERLYRQNRIEPVPPDGSPPAPVYVRNRLVPKAISQAEHDKRLERGNTATIPPLEQTEFLVGKPRSSTPRTPPPEPKTVVITTGRRLVHVGFGKYDILEHDGSLYAVKVEGQAHAATIANGDAEMEEKHRPKAAAIAAAREAAAAKAAQQAKRAPPKGKAAKGTKGKAKATADA